MTFVQPIVRPLFVLCVIAFTTSSFAQSVTLRLGTALDPQRLVPYQTLVERWNAEHPDIQVQLENTPWSEYWQKNLIQTASNSMPDVWNFVPGFGAYWVANDLLLPLNTYIEADKDVNVDDFQQGMMEYMMRDGQILGFPYDVSGVVLFYNKEVFDQAGVAYPNDSWSFEDVRRAGQQIMDELGGEGEKIYGLASVPPSDWASDGFFRSYGASFINEEGRIGVNNEGGVEMLNYFLGNIESGLTPPPEIGTNAPTVSLTLFTNGLAAMLFTGGWDVPTILDGADFEWGLARMPRGPAGHGGTVLGGAFVINSQTEHPQEAYEFLSYLTSTESLNLAVTDTGAGIPGRRSSEEGLSEALREYAGILTEYKPFNAVEGVFEVFDVQRKQFEQLWTGGQTPEGALETIEEEGNQILDD